MQFFNRRFERIAVAAAVGAMFFAGAVGQASAQAQERKYKDNAEYEIYNEVAKDLGAKNFTKAITDLDTWKQKYPESDYKDIRYGLYATAYQGANQPAKVLDVANEVLSGNFDQTFAEPKEGPKQAVSVLFTAITSLPKIPDPTQQQIDIAVKAANKLLVFDKKPEGIADADWKTVTAQLQTAAKNTLLMAALIPGNKAVVKQDWASAASEYQKAIQEYPDNAFIAYQLGTAWYRMARADSSKAAELVPKAVYEFLRAVAIDPTLGGTQKDPKTIVDFANKAYVNLHGSEDGLEQMKQQAKASPLPPAGFTIESAAAIAAREENEFREKYPQLAIWLGVKKELAGPNGPSYFESAVKNADFPKLKGKVVEGKPECRVKEILVSVPRPEEQNAPVVISLKLDKPLTGKVEPGEIEFKGVPTEFSQDPFLLTMDVEKTDITGLQESRCTPAPRAAPKKGATKKK